MTLEKTHPIFSVEGYFDFERIRGWGKNEIEGLESVLKVDSIECEIELSELYELIEFPT